MLNPGDFLNGRYHILQCIDQGGIDNVYLANDNRLGGLWVAIKGMDPCVLPPAEQAWAITAFQREARMLARLNLPFINRVMDCFQENNPWYQAMEYVPRETPDAGQCYQRGEIA